MNLDGWTWEEATLRPTAGLAFNFPGAAGGRGGGGGGGRGGAGASRGTRSDEDAEPAARTRARLRETAGDTTGGLDARAVPAGARSAAGALRDGEHASRTSVTPSRGPSGRTCASCFRPAPTRSSVAGLLKQHDVPVILSSILSLPPREDEFHAYPYQAPGVLAKAGVHVRVLERRLPVLARRAVPGRPRGRVGPVARRRDQGADARRGARSSASTARSAASMPARSRTSSSSPAIRWRFDRRSGT